MPDRIDWKTRIAAALTTARHEHDPDVIEELGQHARALYAAARADGLADAEAIAHVDREIAGWCAEADLLTRPRKRMPAIAAPPAAEPRSRLAGLGQDVRYSVRVLRHQPAFALLAITTLALGIAATTTLFSIVYGVLMKPLPWPEADRLVRVTEVRAGMRTLPPVLTNATYLAWRGNATALEDIAAWSTGSITVSTGGEPERLRVAGVTPSMFGVLRATPLAGSVFTETDNERGRRAVILSEGFWRQRFAGDSNAVGRKITIDGQPYDVVGVMPASFVFPDRETRLWTPYFVGPVLDPRNPDSRSMSVFGSIARLKPGATPEQAASEGTARARTAPDLGMVVVALFGTKSPAEIRVAPWLAQMTADVRPALLVMMAAVGLLFVIGIANVASLQLARASARRREVALRAALGAGTGRLARQLLVENIVLGAAGGATGLALTWLAHRSLPTLLPASFPRGTDIEIELPVALFAVGASMIAAVLIGVLPMLQTRRVALVQALNEDSLAPVGGRVRSGVARTRAMIMAGQVAVAAVLLVGAGLLGRSFVALVNVDRGYAPNNLLAASLILPAHAFPGNRLTAVADQVLARVAQSPGVTRAAVSSVIPLSNRDSLSAFRITPPGGEPREAQAATRLVSPGYFETIGMRLTEGRLLADADTVSAERVAVVNRAFVRAYLPGQVLGADVPLGYEDDTENANPPSRPWKIVGVIDDVMQRSAVDPPRPEIYISYRQLRGGIDSEVPAIVVRTAGDPNALAPIIRGIVRDVDRNASLDAVSTMDQRVLDSLAQPRLYAAVLTAFATFAVVITSVGLFGVLRHGLAPPSRDRRTRRARRAAGTNRRAGAVAGIADRGRRRRRRAHCGVGAQPLSGGISLRRHQPRPDDVHRGRGRFADDLTARLRGPGVAGGAGRSAQSAAALTTSSRRWCRRSRRSELLQNRADLRCVADGDDLQPRRIEVLLRGGLHLRPVTAMIRSG